MEMYQEDRVVSKRRANMLVPLGVFHFLMKIVVEGIELHLAHPDELNVTWVGQEEAMRQLMAAWMVLNERDVPMNPRLLGKPGVGKTTMAYAAGTALAVKFTLFKPP